MQAWGESGVEGWLGVRPVFGISGLGSPVFGLDCGKLGGRVVSWEFALGKWGLGDEHVWG